MATPKETAFTKWLAKKEIEMPPAMLEKMKKNFVASCGVLTQLKKLGDSALSSVVSDLQLTFIEKAILGLILSKLEGSESGQGTALTGTASSALMGVVPEVVSMTDNKNG